MPSSEFCKDKMHHKMFSDAILVLLRMLSFNTSDPVFNDFPDIDTCRSAFFCAEQELICLYGLGCELVKPMNLYSDYCFILSRCLRVHSRLDPLGNFLRIMDQSMGSDLLGPFFAQTSSSFRSCCVPSVHVSSEVDPEKSSSPLLSASLDFRSFGLDLVFKHPTKRVRTYYLLFEKIGVTPGYLAKCCLYASRVNKNYSSNSDQIRNVSEELFLLPFDCPSHNRAISIGMISSKLRDIHSSCSCRDPIDVLSDPVPTAIISTLFQGKK